CLHERGNKALAHRLRGQTLPTDLFDEHGRERLLKKGTVVTEEVLDPLPYEAVIRMRVASDDPRLDEDLRQLEERTERQVETIRQVFEEKKDKIRRGDELPPGVIKRVKAE